MTTFQDLARLEPRLADFEARARAVRDEGTAPLFCSNYHWLPISTDLRRVVGVMREGGEPGAGPLDSSAAYEIAYRFLSQLLPDCRACGCRKFQALRSASFPGQPRLESPAQG
jgi:hypothetical protein